MDPARPPSLMSTRGMLFRPELPMPTTCEHLEPLEAELERRGVPIGEPMPSPYGPEWGLWSEVNCTFDAGPLRATGAPRLHSLRGVRRSSGGQRRDLLLPALPPGAHGPAPGVRRADHAAPGLNNGLRRHTTAFRSPGRARWSPRCSESPHIRRSGVPGPARPARG